MEDRATKCKALLEEADGLEATCDEKRWSAAEEAYLAVDVDGEEKAEFAAQIGRSVDYLWRLRDTWKLYGKNRRAGLSFWQHSEIRKNPPPQRDEATIWTVDERWLAWLHDINKMFMEGANLFDVTDPDDLSTHASLAVALYVRLAEMHVAGEVSNLDEELRQLIAEEKKSLG